MNILSLTCQKLKAFRLTVPSMVLLVLASYRTVTSGDAIVLVGVCAAIVPFICQFKNFPVEREKASALQDVLSSYLLNIILMGIYLAWVLLLTWIGKRFIPGYVVNPHFKDMLFLALCADVVFVSAVIPVCRELKPMQRMIPGLVLTNGMLAFMVLAGKFVEAAEPKGIPGIACGFCGLILVLALGMMVAGYREKPVSENV